MCASNTVTSTYLPTFIFSTNILDSEINFSPIFPHFMHHPSSYPGTVNTGNVSSPMSQVPTLFGIYHLFIRAILGYNLYIVGYVHQVPFCHNVHHSSSYPESVNSGYFWSPLSQAPKLFGIYHLLGFIRDTLGYNLYIVGHVQHVTFSHNIYHSTKTLLT